MSIKCLFQFYARNHYRLSLGYQYLHFVTFLFQYVDNNLLSHWFKIEGILNHCHHLHLEQVPEVSHQNQMFEITPSPKILIIRWHSYLQC